MNRFTDELSENPGKMVVVHEREREREKVVVVLHR